MTGIGPVAVRCPRVRDRGGEGSERIRFSSAILPPYAVTSGHQLSPLAPKAGEVRLTPGESSGAYTLGRKRHNGIIQSMRSLTLNQYHRMVGTGTVGTRMVSAF